MMRRAILLPAAMLLSAPALAQTTTKAPDSLGGPVVAGVCLISQNAILANSRLGQAVSARLETIASAAQAEVDGERKPLDADLEALRNEAARLSAEQRRTREQALAARLAPIQAKADLRSREIAATRTKALQEISVHTTAVTTDVYRRRNCGLLLNRDVVLGGNFTNDLTADIVRGLDARVQTIALERVQLPAAAPAAAGRP